MYVVQVALVCTMCGEQFLDRGRLFDLGSERCWALVITTVRALAIATITTVIALSIPLITIATSTIMAFFLGLCA